MAARELKIVTNHVTCPVCYELYRNPKVLPCQHSYCKDCLSKLEKNKEVACPECRKVAAIPDGGVEEFKTNFLINRLVDDCILKRKVEGEEEVHCEACIESDPVTTFCPECVLFLCEACDNHHKRGRSTHQHAIVPLTDLRSQKDIRDKVKPKKQVILCKKHDIELKFYCETCKELVCLYCITKAHSTHCHDAIKEVAGRHREKLQKTTAPLKGMITKLSTIHSNVSDAKETISKRSEVVKKEVDQFFDDILKKMTDEIKKQRQQLKEELHSDVTKRITLLTLQLKEVEDLKKSVMSVDELVNEIETSSDDELLSGEQQIICCVNELTDSFNEVETDPVESDTFYFAPCHTVPQFGQIITQCEITGFPLTVKQGDIVQFTFTAKGIRVTSPNIGVVNVKVQSVDGDHCVPVTVKGNNDGSYTGSFTAKLAGSYQLSITIGEQHIKRIPLCFDVSKAFHKLIKFKKVVSIDGKMGKPWGIAICNNHYWAVADNTNHFVYIFDRQHRLIRKFGCYGNENGQFNKPCGVAFDGDSCLYVVDGSNNRVQKFTFSGQYLLQFGGESGVGKLNSPVGIAVHLDKVFVADRSNHRVAVFLTNGTYCFSFGSYGNGPGQLINPWDVAITADNNLVVADSGNFRIQLFQLNGTFISKFGTRGSGDGELSWPSSLTVAENGFMFVTEYSNNRVSVFDKSHNFVHCLGSQEVKRPHGIAITDAGSIYISEHDNCRILIYS